MYDMSMYVYFFTPAHCSCPCGLASCLNSVSAINWRSLLPSPGRTRYRPYLWRCRNASDGAAWERSTWHSSNAWIKEMAMPQEKKEGAYSFRTVVRQAPDLVFPMAACLASSLRTLLRWSSSISPGRFTTNKCVGLGCKNPSSPERSE